MGEEKRRDMKQEIMENADNEELVLEICKDNVRFFNYASERLRDDKDLVLQIIEAEEEPKYGRKINGFILEYVSERLKNDFDVVYACVATDGEVLRYASDEMRDNETIAIVACGNSMFALGAVSERLRDDKTFVMKAFEQCTDKNKLRLSDVSERLRGDKDVVSLYCQKGTNLQYAGIGLRDDKEIVLSACIDFGLALEYASKRLQDDEECVREAAKSCSLGVHYASDRIKDDFEIMYSVCQVEPIAYQYLSERLKNNKEIAIKVVPKYPFALEEGMSERLCGDRDVAEAFLIGMDKHGVSRMRYFSEELRDDEELMRKFCECIGDAIYYVSERLRKNKELSLLAIEHGASLYYIDKEFYDDFEVVMKAVKNDAEEIKYASERLRNNPFLFATTLHGYFPYEEYWHCDEFDGTDFHDVIQYIGDDLRKDKTFARFVIKSFLDTIPGKNYTAEFFEDNLSKVYSFIQKEGYHNKTKPEYGLNMSEAIAHYDVL